ncbi:Nif3-like dinuclear metal center hexameric protein [Marinicellulosiphila megalodicopiae]|uniref:Nif3-like dinuclear metal center hexameric protein n=1 Tax=Marinicellulosiphila megalodicopiae TaxID=2724896 RepID=UPI003BB14321
MAIETQDLVQYLDALLQSNKFKDYCPNGLQVQGKAHIGRIITGVSATSELIEKAIELKADAILVHHGYFWKGESQTITGMKYKRIKALLEHDINLFGYHLPLDCHAEFGNNTQLAQIMNWQVMGDVNDTLPKGLVLKGKLKTPITNQQLVQQFKQNLDFDPLLIGNPNQLIENIVWCTGAAQSYLQYAIDESADAFITGEISENTVHQAKENEISYFACGHHATERYGVKSLGEHLSSKFGIEHIFVDCPVPV